MVFRHSIRFKLTSILIITVLSITYAFYNWKSSDTPVTFNISDSYFFCETDIPNNISSLAPVTSYKEGSYQAFNVNNIGRGDTTFSVTLNIPARYDPNEPNFSEVLRDPSFKFQLA